MSKGSKQRPGTGYVEGSDRIWPEPPKYCPGCGLLPSWCACTEDGPGDEAGATAGPRHGDGPIDRMIAALPLPQYGPGQDEAQSDMGIPASVDIAIAISEQNQGLAGQDEASKEVKTHYERRRFDREGV